MSMDLDLTDLQRRYLKIIGRVGMFKSLRRDSLLFGVICAAGACIELYRWQAFPLYFAGFAITLGLAWIISNAQYKKYQTLADDLKTHVDQELAEQIERKRKISPQ